MNKPAGRFSHITGAIWWRMLVLRSRLLNSLQILWHAPQVYRNWPAFFMSRFREGTDTLDLRDGLKVKFRTQSTDRATASEVFLLNAYTRLPEFALKLDDVVVDVGANIGCFTLKAARQCPQGKVIAVEPLRGNFDLLNENVAINKLTNVRTLCLALDATDGTRLLHHGGQCPSLHFSDNAVTSAEVPTQSLKTFLAGEGMQQIDFLKMDCEGAEFDILLAAGADEFARIRRIIMEYHNLSPEKNHLVLAAHLRRHGFQVWLDEGGWNGELRAIRAS